MTWAWTAAALGLAYLLGSVPTGLLLGLHLRGVDIREHGSKNIGATNTMRVLGKRFGAVALAGDMAKGLVAVLVVARLSPWAEAGAACGAAAVAGHVWPVFLRLHGGKGVATACGALLALCPIPTLVAAAVFGVVVKVSRMASLGSITAALVLAVCVFVFPNPGSVRVLAALVAPLVVFRHRSNIRRILNGTESRI